MNRRVGFPFVVPSLIAAPGRCLRAGRRSRIEVSSADVEHGAGRERGPSTGSAVPSAGASDVPATPTPASSTTVRVYFYLGGEPGSDGLVPVERSVAADDPVSGRDGRPARRTDQRASPATGRSRRPSPTAAACSD